MAVEVEAAGLAAERRSVAQELRIREAFARVEDIMETGASTTRADFNFHMAIAEATNNHYFADFLNYLGKAMIPRRNVRLVPVSGGSRQAYLRMIQKEHGQIIAAISNGDVKAARAAMRAHLSESRSRYLALLTDNLAKTS
jgi:DNA-binding FadR family transcriptional regulator